MNEANLNVHNISKKICAIKNVKSMLTITLTLWAADRISSGKISLGTNHPRGPHDHAKPAMYTHMHATKPLAYHGSSVPGFPLIPNFQAIPAVITICDRTKGQVKYKFFRFSLIKLVKSKY